MALRFSYACSSLALGPSPSHSIEFRTYLTYSIGRWLFRPAN